MTETTATTRQPRKVQHSASRQRPRSGIKATGFDVIEKWVKIDFRMPSRIADYLLSRSEHVISKYGFDAAHVGYLAALDLESGKTQAFVCRDLQQRARISSDLCGEPSVPFTVKMKERDWKRMNQVAAALDVDIECLLRASLTYRVESLKRFHAHHAPTAGL